MAFKYHPDSHINDNVSQAKKDLLAKQFTLIKEAYDFLSTRVVEEIEQVSDPKEVVKEDEETLTPEQIKQKQELNQFIDGLMKEREIKQRQMEREKLQKQDESRRATILKN